MEIKWLEDFVSLSQTGSFSKSAEQRHITQSAFSRRIRALEEYLGTELFDRRGFPIKLTDSGRQFRETAEEIIRMLDYSQSSIKSKICSNKQTVTISAIHTLSLTFFPRWFREIEGHIGPLSSRLMVDDFRKCLSAFAEGSYDFLLTFYHSSVPILLDPETFPYCMVGIDSIIAVQSSALKVSGKNLPLLSYAQDSFLGLVTTLAQAKTGGPPMPISHINESALAEAVKVMVLEGHGMAWLPRSIVAGDLAKGRLIAIGHEITLEIRLYCNAQHRRPAVSTVWQAARMMAAKDMPNWNDVA